MNTYKYRQDGHRIGLAVEDMKRHMTNEGWELFAGLEFAGYRLAGYRLPFEETDVSKIVQSDPSVLVIQDKREWTNKTAGGGQNPKYQFHNLDCLKERDDIFKVGILKDAHNDADVHKQFAEETGLHARIVYYDPAAVRRVAPYTENETLIRTFHTVDPKVVPEYSAIRQGCLLSGAASGKAYPLRRRLFRTQLPRTTLLKHPGYHRRSCQTPKYLEILSKHKVAICTSSIYGYALRKIIEATACGCIVVTDLPKEDRLPGIDDNLVRIPRHIHPKKVESLLNELYHTYNSERQENFAEIACSFYDYRAMGKLLSANIEKLRKHYDRN